MFCTACGAKNPGDANFCNRCGHRTLRNSAPKITEEEFVQAADTEERVREMLMLAYQRYETGDLEAAIKTCQQALDERPDSTDAHSLMSTLYEKQGEREKAIAERERVLALNPGSIADREKLDELRDGKSPVKAGRIISSHRTSTSLLDSRAGAALIASCVALLVLGAGATTIWLSRPKPIPIPNMGTQKIADLPPGLTNNGGINGTVGASDGQNKPSTTFNGAPITNGVIPDMNGTSAAPNSVGYSQGPSNAAAINAAHNATSNAANRAALNRLGSGGGPVRDNFREVPPARINLPPANGADRGNFNAAPAGNGNTRGSDQGSTVHLPDNNGLSGAEVGPGPNGNNGGAPSGNSGNGFSGTQGASGTGNGSKGTGRIEIIVSPGAPKPGGNGTNGNSARINGGNTDTTTSSLDSRSQRRIAQDLQSRNQYKQAISAYIKALDGAADDAGAIHQQIGLCYQRLDEKDSAISHYNSAIAAYKQQVSGGHNVDSANRGIRACEAGIKACQ